VQLLVLTKRLAGKRIYEMTYFVSTTRPTVQTSSTYCCSLFS